MTHVLHITVKDESNKAIVINMGFWMHIGNLLCKIVVYLMLQVKL